VRTTSRSSPRRYDAILCRRSLRARVHVRQGELVGPRCLETLFSAMVAARAAARNHYSNRSLYTVADSVRGFCSVRSPQVRSLVSGKPNFAARDRRVKNDGADRTSFRQRPKLSCAPLWGAGRTRTAFLNSRVVGSSPTNSTTHSCAPEISTFVEIPINSGTLRARAPVFDKVSWSDTPTFHNTLVVGSSPTSSTTHSRSTGEFPFEKHHPAFGDSRLQWSGPWW